MQCLHKENYCESVVSQAIRGSLKGDAARIVMVLGPGANITDILFKFESVYGTIDSKATVFQNSILQDSRKMGMLQHGGAGWKIC